MRLFIVFLTTGLLLSASPCLMADKETKPAAPEAQEALSEELSQTQEAPPEAVNGHDPAQCLANIKKEKGRACGSSEPSYSCLDAFKSDAVKNYCSEQPGNTVLELQEVFNPKTQDVKAFATSAELIPFLEENPDYQPRPCYCCC